MIDSITTKLQELGINRALVPNKIEKDYRFMRWVRAMCNKIPHHETPARCWRTREGSSHFYTTQGVDISSPVTTWMDNVNYKEARC